MRKVMITIVALAAVTLTGCGVLCGKCKCCDTPADEVTKEAPADAAKK